MKGLKVRDVNQELNKFKGDLETNVIGFKKSDILELIVKVKKGDKINVRVKEESKDSV